MRRLTAPTAMVIATVALFFSLTGTGIAATGSSSGVIRVVPPTQSVARAHSFTLRAARRAAIRLERSYGVARYVRVGRCRWVTPRKAGCPVMFGPAQIFNPIPGISVQPVAYAWTDYVIRPAWSPGSLFAWAAGLRQIS